MTTCQRPLESIAKNGTVSAAEDRIRTLPTIPFWPVLNLFLLIAINAWVRLYTIFRRGPTQGFTIEINSMLKECFTQMLTDSQKRNSAINNTQMQSKTYSR